MQDRQVVAVPQCEVEGRERETERDATREGHISLLQVATVGTFGAQPQDREQDRDAEEEREAVAVHRLHQSEDEARTEGGAGGSQRSPVVQQPDRREQEDLRGDLRRAVAREGDLWHQDGERRGRGQRRERVAQEPRREQVEDEQRDPAQDRHGQEHQPVAAEVLRLGEQRRQHVREVELQVLTVLLHPRRGRDERRALGERGDERGHIQRAVLRDPLAGVEVERTVAVYLHVLRGVHAVPQHAEQRDHERADRADGRSLGGLALGTRASGRARRTRPTNTTSPNANQNSGSKRPRSARSSPTEPNAAIARTHPSTTTRSQSGSFS